ncbi:hypothetical protein [Ralstonia phage RP13]|nr:hypothetical protein [Ralstonia phage RP13]
MSNFRIKSYLGLSNYQLSYQGKVAYDLKLGINIKHTKKERKTAYTQTKDNYLILSDDRHLVLNYTSICKSGTCYSDYYHYYIVPRQLNCGLVSEFVPEAAEFLVQRMGSDLTGMLSKLVGLLLNNYDVVITDIPGIGGIDISEIYGAHPELWDMGAAELVTANMFRILIDVCGVNLSRYSSKTVVVLLLHNPELASDIATLIGGRSSIPIVLLGS